MRITADLHRKASLGASAKNISLNSYVEQAIEMQVAKDAVAL
ncbi:MAG: toxin-antitoxin system HicB family antitoxin [Clostridia bacterium]|nr:toxin-antitoxin system HicB family antitoxin [Clostridia bacterium]